MSKELEEKILKHEPSLVGIIDRFEGNKAVIVIDDNQIINWPADKLPKGSAEGSAVRIFIKANPVMEAEKVATAKAILNEILNTANET
ncbi:MAG: DUF3006 domain-containing protein [bacterium]